MSKLGNRATFLLMFTLFLLSSCTLPSPTTSDAPEIDNSVTPKPSLTATQTTIPSLGATKTAIPSSTKAPSVTPKPSSTKTPSVTPNPPTSSPTMIVIPTPNPAEPLTQYRDDRLCFVVEVPKTWRTDGTRGGFAAFTPPNQSTFNISNVSLEGNPTLQQAQEHLQQGPLGTYVGEIKEVSIDQQLTRWVSFTESEFQLVALVIAPDCGDGPHALFISARRPADENLFEWFLTHVGFIR